MQARQLPQQLQGVLSGSLEGVVYLFTWVIYMVSSGFAGAR